MSRPLFAAAIQFIALWSLLAPATAWADTNPTPIAVPLIGTQGVAAPYPSRQVVVSRSGPATTGAAAIVLHGVTHPCAEDLAVLLVRNNTDTFLLMSNAGGCRPTEGTSLLFHGNAVPLPDDGPLPPLGFGPLLSINASNYGAAPVFPAPAPPGPYTVGMPPATTPVSGTWDLYVMDTRGDGRGVIAGGWSFLYPTDIVRPAAQTNVPLPGNSAGAGPAFTYPMTFDLTDVPVGVTVADTRIEVRLSHTVPDDIRLALQSPAGTTVILMANVGGSVVIPANTRLAFNDSGQPMPDGGPITGNTDWAPTAVGDPALAAPAPQPPYRSGLSSFRAEPARGTWRLWAFDDTAGNTGLIASATLRLATEDRPDLTLDLPLTSTQPFVRVTARSGSTIAGVAAGWRLTNGGTFYDAGPFVPDPEFPDQFVASFPVKQGANDVVVYGINTSGALVAEQRTVTVTEFTYAFAEGATGSFFDLDLTLANPNASAATIAIDVLPEGGAPIVVNDVVHHDAPFQFSVDGVVTGAVSSVVHSVGAVPLAAERTMIWDATGYGGHGGSSAAPDTRWLFAEGSQGFFDTFVLLANDTATDAAVQLDFLVEGADVVSVPVTVPARTRRTIFAGSIPGLVNRSFGIDISSSVPIIAERAMYLPGRRLFEGGHESAGVNRPSRVWFLAEGATGSFFDCFVLLGNPNPAPAHATMTYLLPTGATIVRNVTVPASGRLTINLETVDPALASADVSTTIVSDLGIVAERAMYWPDFSVGWREAHDSFGVTETALRWGLADGRVGGARAFQTFVLLANPNANPAEIDVRFLKTGSSASRSYVLAPFSRRSILVNSEVPELGDGVFSVDVQVRNFQPIAVEKALYWNSGGEVFAGGTNVTATRLPPP